MSKNILVTGGAGFIGSHLCDALLARQAHVICIDNLSRGKTENLESAMACPCFCFIHGDAADEVFLAEVMHRYQIDTVFHLAANSDIQASAQDPQIEYETTLGTTWGVLSAMRKTGVHRMIFASTSAVYGEPSEHPFHETDPIKPVSYYGAAKAGSEAMIHAFSHMNDMNVWIFRFANVIGSRLTHGVIYDFIRKLQNNSDRLEVLGNGTQTKPYIHVNDLIRAMLSVTEQPSEGVSIYNVGVKTATSVSSIAEMIRQEMKLPEAEIIYGAQNIGWKGDIPRFKFDLTRIYQTGWRPTMTSDEAVLSAIREEIACRR